MVIGGRLVGVGVLLPASVFGLLSPIPHTPFCATSSLQVELWEVLAASAWWPAWHG